MAKKTVRKARNPEPDETPGKIRLPRFLAMAGVEARRECDEFITSGRVSVDGETVLDLSCRVDPDNQQVRLDGERLRLHRKLYYMVNKPVGYLCTNEDPLGRRRALELVPTGRERLFTVGRLDENSQGLLIITNDGELANQLAHPRYRVPKVYRVHVAGIPSKSFIEKMEEGMHFFEGRFKVDEARIVKVQGASAILELVLTEGQNREIRRMLAKIGHKVMKLQRVALGPLKLGPLELGAFRPLTFTEIAQLRDFTTGNRPRRTRIKRGPKGTRKKSAEEAKSSAGAPASGRPRREKPAQPKSPSQRKPRHFDTLEEE